MEDAAKAKGLGRVTGAGGRGWGLHTFHGAKRALATPGLSLVLRGLCGGGGGWGEGGVQDGAAGLRRL